MKAVSQACKWAVVAVLATLLVACGGGGGGGGDTAVAPPAVADEGSKNSVILAVGFYDATTGFERMLNTVGTARLTGSGTLAVTACGGGGTLQSQRVGTLFTVVAANCKLLASDGLVYDGTWAVNLSALPAGYAADGSCNGTCSADGGVTTSGKFGYGTATERTYGYRIAVGNTAGVETVTSSLVSFPDVIDGISVTINMTRVRTTPGNASTNLTVALGSGQNIVSLTGSNDRQSFQMTDAISASVAFGAAGVTAAIDKDRNGTVDSTLVIPWADFL